MHILEACHNSFNVSTHKGTAVESSRAVVLISVVFIEDCCYKEASEYGHASRCTMHIETIGDLGYINSKIQIIIPILRALVAIPKYTKA